MFKKLFFIICSFIFCFFAYADENFETRQNSLVHNTVSLNYDDKVANTADLFTTTFFDFDGKSLSGVSVNIDDKIIEADDNGVLTISGMLVGTSYIVKSINRNGYIFFLKNNVGNLNFFPKYSMCKKVTPNLKMLKKKAKAMRNSATLVKNLDSDSVIRSYEKIVKNSLKIKSTLLDCIYDTDSLKVRASYIKLKKKLKNQFKNVYRRTIKIVKLYAFKNKKDNTWLKRRLKRTKKNYADAVTVISGIPDIDYYEFSSPTTNDSENNVNDETSSIAIIDFINNIGEIKYSEECANMLNIARLNYDEYIAKGGNANLIINYEKLLNAEEKYAELKAENAIAQIHSAEGSISDRKSAIASADAIYGEMSEKIKSKLEMSDEFRYGYGDIENAKAALEVDEKILLIGDVKYSDESKSKIERARIAYNALSSSKSKYFYSAEDYLLNYALLIFAESSYKQKEFESRMFMDTDNNVYIKLDYIESVVKKVTKKLSVGGWINTRIIPDNKTKVEIVYALTEPTAYYVYDVSASGGNKDWGIGVFGSSDLNKSAEKDFTISSLYNSVDVNGLDISYRVGRFSGSNPIDLQKHTVILEADSNFSSSAPNLYFYLFSSNNVNSRYASTSSSFSRQSYSSSRIYSAKIWKSDELVADFIPVYNKTAGQFGMFDNVTGKFFGNQAKEGELTGPYDPSSDAISIKVLFLGNSFTQDATQYLPYLLTNVFESKSLGYLAGRNFNVTLGRSIVGGRTLGYYANCARHDVLAMNLVNPGTYIGYLADNTNYDETQTNNTYLNKKDDYEVTYSEWSSGDVVHTAGTTEDYTTNSSIVTLTDALNAHHWDLIILQGYREDYREVNHKSENMLFMNNLMYLTSFIKENSDAKIEYFFHWELIEKDGSRLKNTASYDKVVDYIKNEVESNGLSDFIVPVGTTIQNARTTYLGDLSGEDTSGTADESDSTENDNNGSGAMYYGIMRDNRHLNRYLGRFIAGVTVADVIASQIDVGEVNRKLVKNLRSYSPNIKYPVQYIDIAYFAADAALNGKYTVTDLGDKYGASKLLGGNNVIEYKDNDPAMIAYKSVIALLRNTPNATREECLNAAMNAINNESVWNDIIINDDNSFTYGYTTSPKF